MLGMAEGDIRFRAAGLIPDLPSWIAVEVPAKIHKGGVDGINEMLGRMIDLQRPWLDYLR
jgi:hypothetical protein